MADSDGQNNTTTQADMTGQACPSTQDGHERASIALDSEWSDLSFSEPGIDPYISWDEFDDLYHDRYSMDTEELEEYWTNLWERHPGILHSWFEPSHLPESKPSRYYTKLFIDYEYCTPAELKRFVNKRGLKDPYPAGITLKYPYIRLLERADRERRFRFMDLPPEMRLLVYRDILLFKPSKDARKQCNTAILRTCSQIHKEATGVLYDENTFICSYSTSTNDTGNLLKSAVVHNHTTSTGCVHMPYLQIPQGIDDYPKFLQRMARLTIDVSCELDVVEDDPLVECYWPLNHFLYTLASFLMDGHRLRSVEVRVHIDDDLDDQDFGKIFYPLRRLRNVRNVQISGMPDKYKKKLIADMKSNEPAFNTMRQWKLLEDETVAHLNLLEALHGEVECLCGQCPMPECIEDLLENLRQLNEGKIEDCLNSRLEENLIARLAKLRNTLLEARVDDLEDLVEAVKAKRAALKEYEAVTDDGRLDEAAKIWYGKLYNDAEKYGSDHDWSDTEMDEDNHTNGLEGSLSTAGLTTNMEDAENHGSDHDWTDSEDEDYDDDDMDAPSNRAHPSTNVEESNEPA